MPAFSSPRRSAPHLPLVGRTRAGPPPLSTCAGGQAGRPPQQWRGLVQGHGWPGDWPSAKLARVGRFAGTALGYSAKGHGKVDWYGAAMTLILGWFEMNGLELESWFPGRLGVVSGVEQSRVLRSYRRKRGPPVWGRPRPSRRWSAMGWLCWTDLDGAVAPSKAKCSTAALTIQAHSSLTEQGRRGARP